MSEVSVLVKGFVTVEILDKYENYNDIKEITDDKVSNIDFGDLEDISWEIVDVY